LQALPSAAMCKLCAIAARRFSVGGGAACQRGREGIRRRNGGYRGRYGNESMAGRKQGAFVRSSSSACAPDARDQRLRPSPVFLASAERAAA
jgi:hypothetical protein